MRWVVVLLLWAGLSAAGYLLWQEGEKPVASNVPRQVSVEAGNFAFRRPVHVEPAEAEKKEPEEKAPAGEPAPPEAPPDLSGLAREAEAAGKRPVAEVRTENLASEACLRTGPVLERRVSSIYPSLKQHRLESRVFIEPRQEQAELLVFAGPYRRSSDAKKLDERLKASGYGLSKVRSDAGGWFVDVALFYDRVEANRWAREFSSLAQIPNLTVWRSPVPESQVYLVFSGISREENARVRKFASASGMKVTSCPGK